MIYPKFKVLLKIPKNNKIQIVDYPVYKLMTLKISLPNIILRLNKKKTFKTFYSKLNKSSIRN